MKTRWLSTTDKQITGADLCLILDYADVAAATTATGVTVLAVLAGTKVQVTGMRLLTPFDVTGTGALTVSVGDAGSATSLMAATVVALDGTEILYSVGGAAKVYLTNDNVLVTWTDATSMAYTVGKLLLYLRVENMNDWAQA